MANKNDLIFAYCPEVINSFEPIKYVLDIKAHLINGLLFNYNYPKFNCNDLDLTHPTAIY